MTSIQRILVGATAALAVGVCAPSAVADEANGGALREVPLEGAVDTLAESSGLVFADFYADW